MHKAPKGWALGAKLQNISQSCLLAQYDHVIVQVSEVQKQLFCRSYRNPFLVNCMFFRETPKI